MLPRSDACTAGHLGSIGLPSTLQDALALRLRALNEDEDVQRLLWLAAVLGGQFQIDAMRVMWALRDDCTTDEALQAAVGKALQHKVLVSRGSSGYTTVGQRRRSSAASSSLVYAFAHLKLFDAVVNMIEPAARS